ncbi:DNRLRE domain-containing protein [Haliangium sp. UPWRP_2]|uniref:CBM96 family carbohydrate-binding protein n=1 Tax=Haliangium sp. UPWRP_2 TaxID=1931276 RepID=UPI000B540F71|nr:DNRLRE domain-containing protein [Haliangium sp. UPWRP_2]PSM30854.1 hypothetical protein BVG81_008380 [Haliangium sp. UPWRP_2]
MHNIKHSSKKALPRAARRFLRVSALSLLIAPLVHCGGEQQGPNGAGVRAANAATITLLPIADTYARGGSYAAQNFGTAIELIVREAAGQDNDRQAFLKFDTGGFDGTVTSAKLRMYSSWGGSSSNSVTTHAHAVADLSWTETGLTWNNKPALGSVLASVTYTSQTPSYKEYDVTNYVQSERTAGRNLLALALSNPSVSTVYITGASREASANPPQLLVVYTPCSSPYTKTRLTSPARTEVTDASGWVATYTDASYTVTHRGTSRTFSEPLAPETGGTQTVTHSVYIRVLTAPWPAQALPSDAEIAALLANNAPDVLAIGMQYVNGALDVYQGNLRIAGNANYGLAIGSDFNDYLGVAWDYGAFGGVDPPETSEYGQLDCSGFMRMIFGYRSGVPLTKDYQPGRAIPRSSDEMCDPRIGVGTTLIADTGTRPADAPATYAKLNVGDVVCFDATDPDGVIDHVGIFLGVDGDGKHRILNSRNSLNGPTMKDSASGTSASALEGTGWMPNGWRSAVRF